MFGGWPHEVAAFPFRYYRMLRNYYLFDKERQRKAMMDPTDIDPLASADWDAEVVKIT